MQTQTLPHTETYLQAVTTAAAQALTKYPTAAARITRAVDLAVDGHVSAPRQRRDGRTAYLVRSQECTHLHTALAEACLCEEYEVVGLVCNCEDFERHATRTTGYLCKHIFAVCLTRKAARVLQPYYYRRRGWHYAPLCATTRAQVERHIHLAYNGTSAAQLAALDAGGVIETPHARYVTDPAQLPPHVRRLQPGDGSYCKGKSQRQGHRLKHLDDYEN